MNQEMRDTLTAPFPPESIGKKPTIWCRACERRECTVHSAVPCIVCHQTITTAHEHLDFVGHAYVTERLFAVDPDWDWEPVAHGPDGLPAFDEYGGLWIWLTIGGKRRKGYGHADGRKDGDGKLIAIGHAIRIAAMRGFGVALDMWKPEPRIRHVEAVESAAVDEVPDESDNRTEKQLREEIKRLGHRKGLKFLAVLREFEQWANGQAEFATADVTVLRAFEQHLTKASQMKPRRTG